jgi:methionyl-tRNA formyltransferase
MYPWPACHVRLLEGEREVQRVTLVRARAAGRTGSASAGLVAPDGTIATSDGAVEVVELQPANGKVMSLAAYRNGHPWSPGMCVESV